MNRKRISIFILFSLAFSLGMNSIFSTTTNINLVSKQDTADQNAPKTSGYTNSDILFVTYGQQSSGDWLNYYDRNYFNIWFGNEWKSCIQFWWVDEIGTKTGWSTFVLAFENQNAPGSTTVAINHDNYEISVFNESNSEVPFDNAYTLNMTEHAFPLSRLDKDVFTFPLIGDVEWLKENGGLDDSYGILDFTMYDLYETIENGTSVLNWGVSGTLVRSDPITDNWNINATVDYREFYHFSAVNGKAKLKWDFILENITINPVLIVGYNSSDLKIANCYEINAAQCPQYGWENHEAADYNFTGIKLSTSNSYIVNTTDINAGEINLGEIDFGGNYLWNNTSYEKIMTTITHTNICESTLINRDYRNPLILTQTFNKFKNGSINVDPDVKISYLKSIPDEDDDDTDKKEDTSLILYIIIGTICACVGGGALATILIVKKIRKRTKKLEQIN